MSGPRLLQWLCLALLWLQLLLQGQLQLLVALALPVLLVLRWRQPQLPRSLLLSITLSALLLWGIGASLSDRTAMLRSACNLLWLLSGLKLLEARSHNDQRRCSLLLLLAVGLAGLASQQLGASLLQGLCALLALASLLALEGGPRPLGQVLRRSGTVVAVALPLMVSAFLLLPRLEPLWSLQLGGTGRSGIGDRLAPGELASLVQDDGLAARVSFAGAGPPPQAERYWRVLVHQRFDGTSWSSSSPESPQLQLSGPSADAPVSEQWMVEASGLRQRPWSGSGAVRDRSLAPTVVGTLTGSAPLQQRTLYALAEDSSAAVWRVIGPSAIDLEMPAAANPRLRALGERWAAQGTTSEARVLLARQWFLNQGFRYTLAPGRLGTIDPLDRFLFETREGFCEHFAASFSGLMRAAGVPARVVVGYQGGRWQQPAGSDPYLELRNSDAHAWSEVWLPSSGWVRIDPTAWVVPERIRRSLAASLSSQDQQLLSAAPPGWIEAAINQWQGLIAITVMAAALMLGLLPLLRQPATGDAPRRQLLMLLNLLERRDHNLEPGESLESFCRRVSLEEPLLSAGLSELQERYEAWRFGPAVNPVEQRELLVCLAVLRRQVLQLGRRPARRPRA